MKRYIVPILIVGSIFVSGVLAGCGQASSSDSLKTYTNYTYGYSIKYPASWKLDESGETVNVYSSFRAYVSIGVLEGKRLTAEDLEWLVENMVEELRTDIDDFHLISDRQLYDMVGPAWEITYTGNTDQGLPFKARCRCIVYGDRVYVLNAVAPGTELTSEILAVLNSFALAGATR